MGSLSYLFGYILNFIYNLVSNYGIAIILFSVLLKLLLLPLSIKQQKTLIKTTKIQDKIKNIQSKYTKQENGRLKPEEQQKMNEELMALYKKEGISPFSGCLPTILQFVLLIAIFGVVRNPLTYMLKVDQNTIQQVSKYIQEENTENTINSAYPQVSVLKYVSENKDKVIYIGNNEEQQEEIVEINEQQEENQVTEQSEQQEENQVTEQSEQQEENQTTENNKEIKLQDLYINMNFFSLNLNNIPKDNLGDFRVYIIPVLYVLTSVLSMKLTTTNSSKKNKKENEIKIENKENELENKKKEEFNMSEQMSKNMSLVMPIMAVAISVFAPLGLALYWLMNNILMILERIVIAKMLDLKKGEGNE